MSAHYHEDVITRYLTKKVIMIALIMLYKYYNLLVIMLSVYWSKPVCGLGGEVQVEAAKNHTEVDGGPERTAIGVEVTIPMEQYNDVRYEEWLQLEIGDHEKVGEGGRTIRHPRRSVSKD
jgi:hypothetical protein